MDYEKFLFDEVIDSYFKNTPLPEWTYMGYLKTIRPYFISEARMLKDQKAIWRKRYLTYLTKCEIVQPEELREGVVPSLNMGCRSSGSLPEEDFWNDVKIKKQLMNKEQNPYITASPSVSTLVAFPFTKNTM
ncbi:7976_t:CDS:2, partial [Racocetra persica]